jgi:cysteine desulfurase
MLMRLDKIQIVLIRKRMSVAYLLCRLHLCSAKKLCKRAARPGKEPLLYLDNIANMPVDPRVFQAMVPYLGEQFGNPSSIHGPGRRAHDALDEARGRLARLLQAESSEVYMTPSGTHSNNTVLLGRARYCEANGLGKHALISSFEHSSVSQVMRFLQEARGWTVTMIAPQAESWHLQPQQLQAAITPDTSVFRCHAAHQRTACRDGGREIVFSLRCCASAGPRSAWRFTG